ncbi:uncharacterized protein LOC128728520 [Anopheles nili]|uniref:uncharacterized protein LOC128728520 n=1 Tax=Anopheles nili TaxID=185578 RepID=UPI00237BF646|nr:uncharacterized protein LOC128728520 [Anopheles nili]
MVASEPEEDVAKHPPAMESNEATTPSKASYRQEVWTAMRIRLFPQGLPSNNFINRKIPFFPEAEQTAERLAETPEFKEAKNVKVNIDMAQETVKLIALKTNKTLFVAPSQKSDYLYAKIKMPKGGGGEEEEVSLVQQKRIVKMLGGEDTYEELGIDQMEPLDMVVVGCVAVSQTGQRIGKGNGYVDLEIAILMSLGAITAKTVIATTVADEQLYDTLPNELFQPYDFTVDLIVTPTRVVRVPPRKEPRAIGVQWNLLSSRRLEVVRVLKRMKERLEAEGQVIVLKEEDTDVESFRKTRTHGGATGGHSERRRTNNRRRRYTRNGHADSKEGDEAGEGEAGGERGSGRMRRKRFNTRRNRNTGHEGGPEYEQKDGENGGSSEPRPQDAPKQGGRMRTGGKARSGGGPGGGPPEARPNRQPKPHLQAGVRIRVSNMFSVRFKDFKDELRARDCYPAKINKGRYGKCMLIFSKQDDAEEQTLADELLQKLAHMRIAVPQKGGAEPKQVELKCELLQRRRHDGGYSARMEKESPLYGAKELVASAEERSAKAVAAAVEAVSLTGQFLQLPNCLQDVAEVADRIADTASEAARFSLEVALIIHNAAARMAAKFELPTTAIATADKQPPADEPATPRDAKRALLRGAVQAATDAAKATTSAAEETVSLTLDVAKVPKEEAAAVATKVAEAANVTTKAAGAAVSALKTMLKVVAEVAEVLLPGGETQEDDKLDINRVKE